MYPAVDLLLIARFGPGLVLDSFGLFYNRIPFFADNLFFLYFFRTYINCWISCFLTDQDNQPRSI